MRQPDTLRQLLQDALTKMSAATPSPELEAARLKIQAVAERIDAIGKEFTHWVGR